MGKLPLYIEIFFSFWKMLKFDKYQQEKLLKGKKKTILIFLKKSMFFMPKSHISQKNDPRIVHTQYLNKNKFATNILIYFATNILIYFKSF